jgi:uncharacterized membrane protein YeaQ/YmgE (transglycosylase-associated protein family)
MMNDFFRPLADLRQKQSRGEFIMASLVLGLTLAPGGLLAWLIVGLIAGFLASMIMRGGGYGIVGDIIVGIIGAFLGGVIATALGFGGSTGFVGSIIIALIGAVILIAILRALTGRRGRRRRRW